MSYSQIRCIALRVSKLRMRFCVPSIIWVGVELMQITRQRTLPAWPAKTKLRMTLNCSRIANEIAMISGIFVEGRRQSLLYSCKRPQKASKKTSRSLPETMRNRVITSSEPWKTETNKVDGNTPITSKHLFQRGPLRWLTEQKHPKFLRSLQNAQRDTTNLAIIDYKCNKALKCNKNWSLM